jgi:1-acyl-sn-glycerol-3-phosphate acyltransferase
MKSPSTAGIRDLVRQTSVAVGLVVALAEMSVASRRDPDRARRVANRWLKRLARLARVRFETAGAVPTGLGTKVLVANHSSPLDIAAVLDADPDVTFVAAADLFRVPVLAGAMRALQTVPVNRRSSQPARLSLPEGLDTRRLKLTIFPEGGIAPAGERLPFRHSAFALAIELQAEVVPVAISGSAAVLPPKGHLRPRPGTVRVEFLEAIPTSGLTLDDRHQLCRQVEQRLLGALGPEDGGYRSGPAGTAE